MGKRTTQIKHIIDHDFADWGLTNYGSGYTHLAKPGATINVKAEAKNADARLHMGCHAFLGKRKSTSAASRTGRQAFQNGGGCCTTSAFAVVFKLLEAGITDRIEIIGQGSHDNGHMWVVVGRTGDTVQDGKVKRPANAHDDWGSYIVCDVWLKAFGWPGVWKKPPGGKHHFFIDNDHDHLEVTYDSLIEDGDDLV
jgi:hypothetical protein